VGVARCIKSDCEVFRLRHPSFLISVAFIALPITSVGETHDAFHHLGQINKASIVMLAEERIVPDELAAVIATGIARVIDEQAEEGARRSANYLDFEARLLELAGAEASRLHTGRSRQDIGSTYRRMGLRENLLDTYDALLAARMALLDVAAAHVDTIIPAYTHGVQAQPTTLAHYLLAFSAAFERDAERLEAAYSRLNLSPLGAAAFGTSGFAIDRERLAELLGFDSVVENSYDANLVSSVDSKIEFANALSTSAIMVGQLMQNLHTQYHNPVPWIQLAEESTDVSSIMPQKRNPRPLDRVRLLATSVVGSAHTVTLNAHNTNSGMNDYRPGTQAADAAAKAQEMYAAYVDVMRSLVVDPARSLQEVDIDYSTMTEVADVLLRHAEVPFRVGHHYASELTTYGRAHGKRPKDLTDEELTQLYEESIGESLPVEVELIRQAMDPVTMVRNRKGLGGPQEQEVVRMLARHNDSLASGLGWLDLSRTHLQNSATTLERAFAELK
jgi:argininosuccinate lyase